MMRQYILAAKQNPGTLVNKVGKYLHKNIDGAFKIEFKPMECVVRMRMYYQIPGDPDSLDEMQFLLSITSYQNKLRINLTEDTAMEKTIGQIIMKPEDLTDIGIVRKKVMDKIEKFISKEYADYDFIY